MRPKLIAITGGLATGKSTFLRLLQSLGFTTLSCDDIVKKLYESESIKNKLRDLLGEDIFTEDFQIDKKKLLVKILQDPSLRGSLEAFIHPLVWREIEEEIKISCARGEKIIFVEVPLLFEVGWETFFDEVWVITCSEETHKRRIKEKPDSELWMRLSEIQIPLSEKEKRADRLFSSEVPVSQWEKEIKKILRNYLKEQDPP